MNCQRHLTACENSIQTSSLATLSRNSIIEGNASSYEARRCPEMILQAGLGFYKQD